MEINRRTKLLCVSALVSSLALVPSAAMATGEAKFVNKVVAVDTKSKKDVFRLGFRIDQTAAPEATAINFAKAVTADCTGCEATAIAFQVFVSTTSAPANLHVDNSAVALSYRCVECSTLAAAYQFVVPDSHRSCLSTDTIRELRGIEKKLRALQHSPLPAEQLQASVDELADATRAVLQETIDRPSPGARTGSVAADTGPQVKLHRKWDRY